MMIDTNSTSLAIVETTPYVRPFSDDATVLSATLLLTMMVFGITANLVTMIVILRSEKLKSSIFNLLIVSLCISDLLSALVSPLFLYRRTWGFDVWLLPGIFCKIFWAVDTWTSYVTALHILVFAIVRLISIQWPLLYKKVQKLQVKITICSIWILTLLCGFVPRWVWYEAQTHNRYASTPNAKWPACTLNIRWLAEYKLYYKIAFTLFIYVPMGIIFFLSPVIAILILIRRRRRMNRTPASTSEGDKTSKKEVKIQTKENFAILQLAFITGSFMFGYIPITSYTFHTTMTTSYTLSQKMSDWNFGMVSYILLRLSESLNPVFYNAASSKMRAETFLFIKKATKCGPTLCGTSEPANMATSSTSENSSRNTHNLQL